VFAGKKLLTDKLNFELVPNPLGVGRGLHRNGDSLQPSLGVQTSWVYEALQAAACEIVPVSAARLARGVRSQE